MLSAPDPPLAVQEVRALDGLETLRDEWWALWDRCPWATPFQSPGWLIPWCRHLGGGWARAWTFRHGGELVGLAPLSDYVPPETGERTVLLLGTGITDYLDVVIAPGWEGPVMAALFGRLGEESGRWDVLDFQQVRPSSPLRTAPLPPGWSRRVEPQDACPVLDLGAVAPGTPRWRKRLGYDRRRGDRMGPLRLERADASNFPRLFEDFLRLHGERWSAAGQAGVLADDALRRFHAEAAEALLGAGLLRLYGMSLGDRAVAAHYGFHRGTTAFYYLGGFDPEYRSLGLGALMVGHAIERAAEEGATTFDFLRGQEPYKYEWGAKDRPNYRIVVRRGPPS